jgi:hypothetical protein
MMKRKQTWLSGRAAWVLGVAAILWQQASAQACEGCKQALKVSETNPAITSASLGYGLSVLFLLITAFSVVGSLGWMIVRNCRALDRAHAAAAREDDPS